MPSGVSYSLSEVIEFLISKMAVAGSARLKFSRQIPA